MGSNRKKHELPQANEVLEMKRREIAEEKGVEPYVDPLIEAMRQDEATERAALAEREESAGRVAPAMEAIIEDDMRTEKDIQKEKDDQLLKELTSVLKVPKTRESIPTFSMYTVGMMRRYFILDVDGTAYRKGWALYQTYKGNDPVGYIDMVIHIMDAEIPRLHRAVDWAPLN